MVTPTRKPDTTVEGQPPPTNGAWDRRWPAGGRGRPGTWCWCLAAEAALRLTRMPHCRRSRTAPRSFQVPPPPPAGTAQATSASGQWDERSTRYRRPQRSWRVRAGRLASRACLPLFGTGGHGVAFGVGGAFMPGHVVVADRGDGKDGDRGGDGDDDAGDDARYQPGDAVGDRDAGAGQGAGGEVGEETAAGRRWSGRGCGGWGCCCWVTLFMIWSKWRSRPPSSAATACARAR